ncbi:hypothetical protein [Bradyrhizobium sp. CCGUVB23]|nr:hypothetical protein [Bradyrhizobium sp. CCGUVB23]
MRLLADTPKCSITNIAHGYRRELDPSVLDLAGKSRKSAQPKG